MQKNSIISLSIWSNQMINAFLITGEKHVLVDTGLPGSELKILAQLKKLRINYKDIGLIIITHGHIDHFGSASSLSKLIDSPILAHSEDLEAYRSGTGYLATMKPTSLHWWIFRKIIKNQKTQPFEPNIQLSDNEEYSLSGYGIDGKVIHTPGHTPGSLSIILENGEAIIMDMMASGILLGGIMWLSRVKHPPFHDDLKQLKGSFDKLLQYNSDKYYLGHGGPVNRKQLKKYRQKLIV